MRPAGMVTDARGHWLAISLAAALAPCSLCVQISFLDAPPAFDFHLEQEFCAQSAVGRLRIDPLTPDV